MLYPRLMYSLLFYIRRNISTHIDLTRQSSSTSYLQSSIRQLSTISTIYRLPASGNKTHVTNVTCWDLQLFHITTRLFDKARIHLWSHSGDSRRLIRFKPNLVYHSFTSLWIKSSHVLSLAMQDGTIRFSCSRLVEHTHNSFSPNNRTTRPIPSLYLLRCHQSPELIFHLKREPRYLKLSVNNAIGYVQLGKHNKSIHEYSSYRLTPSKNGRSLNYSRLLVASLDDDLSSIVVSNDYHQHMFTKNQCGRHISLEQ